MYLAKVGEWREMDCILYHISKMIFSTQLSLDQNRLTSKHAVELKLSVYLIHTESYECLCIYIVAVTRKSIDRHFHSKEESILNKLIES